MPNVLTKYSKTSTLSGSDIEFERPYNFYEWQARNFGLVPTKEYDQYYEYLRRWYLTYGNKEDVSKIIRNQYIVLLNELSISFPGIDFSWLKEKNLSDDWDLETLIPYYARKLKEIAIYIASKRETIKNAKLKYNMVGATQALEKLFYTYILKAFTKKNQILEIPALATWTELPELSAINKSFHLSIEELYDDTKYFDKDPKISSSRYFNITGSNTISFFENLNFPTSAIEWLYSSGFMDLSADNPNIWISPITTDELPLSAFESTDRARLNEYNYFDASKKYLGEPQWLATGSYYLPFTKLYTFDFVELNNWFYWPSGEYYTESEDEIVFDPIQLSATNFASLGTASNDHSNADKIFVRKGDIAEAAWLSQIDYQTTNETMSAILEGNNKTIFKFPWPGYGLSGEDVAWSGVSFSNTDKNFEYLENKYKKAIISAYWNNIDDNEIEPIPINNTKLVDGGALASSTFLRADKIITRNTESDDGLHDLTPDAIYTADKDYAWLYKFTATQIPIQIGANSIIWPLARVDTTTTPLLSASLPTYCSSIALSSISTGGGFLGSTAGATLSASDVIFKLDAFGSTITEVAWLSGKPTTTIPTADAIAYNGRMQSGFSIKANPGQYSLFLWTASDTPVDTVFAYTPHLDDCPYKVSPRAASGTLSDLDIQNFNTELGTDRWDYCTCGAFNHSPCGHSGLISDYFGIHDFICEDVQFVNNTTFNISNWIDEENNSIEVSNNAAWYRTNNSGIGYGEGSWIPMSNSGTLTLKRGHVYRYFRTTLKRNSKQFSIPYLVTKLRFYQNPPIWINALQQSDGSWISSGTLSKMVFNYGEMLLYSHYDASSTVAVDTVRNPAINFLITASLSGWDYSAHSISPFASGAKPYWAEADDDFVATQAKGISVYGGKTSIVDDYTRTNLPVPSNIILKNGTYLEYDRIGESIFWIEAIQLSTYVGTQQWNTLSYNASTNLDINITTEPSKILLEPGIEINYYAMSPFTLTQELTASTLGLPPTGGILVPPLSSILISPSEPCTNLLNRHYPTIANVPVLNFYSKDDVGGYFIPQGLGISTYLGKDYKITWE